ncbi:type III-B CRISPR module RAMP protein Cmr6 [Caenispirillum bisanense]|uniref:type III-B CRISPR module RAMP protein Cmr6 n=1 Tax=Caenispirillum bisanense TaxID=414052 RepID=UPI0031DED79C
MIGRPLTPGGVDGFKAVEARIGSPSANQGLVWDRYLPLWSGYDSRPSMNGGGMTLKRALDDLVKRHKDAEKQAAAWMKERLARRQRALEQLEQNTGRTLRVIKLRTQGRFATGLGADHPSENGFSFDPTTGLPVIAGSGIKGLCRRAAVLQGAREEDCLRWFGPETIAADTDAGCGSVTFFDALPTAWPRLAVDIINNHHSDYYVGKGKGKDQVRRGPPVTANPVPVYFLTVEKGAEFSFALLGPAEDVEAMEEILRLGAEWLGLGAKTAAGYGRLDPVP